MKIVVFAVVLLLIGSFMGIYFQKSPALSSLPETIDYSFHVRPILADNCFACHGPDANKRKADLRLDTEEGLYGFSEGIHSIVKKGSPQESELFLRVSHEDSSEVMPPPSSNLSLTPEEITILERWIAQGAEYKSHWAFSKPVKSEIGESDWGLNEIDYLVYKKMREKGLRPNDRADPERLLKRLSFDLTGLPPDLELQDEFLEDPKLYEEIVDRLLADDHYGERMAIGWMDVARYADSHGYQDDGYRTMWPWRDWVIHAFNENYPYDRFVRMQLSGDLFEQPTKEDLLATGFNRNHKITQEGGVIDEEYRVEYVTDRTNTFGKAFLGLTLECAKCHDHKYDPVSMKEYYQTFAFFDRVPEKGLFGDISVASLADPPYMQITDKDVAELLTFINKKDTGNVAVMVMKDSVNLRETYILDRGVYDAKGEVVTPGTPADILAFDTTKYTSDRNGLADWLLDRNNPLTARVFVNRIWQQFFGRGIVSTPGDFGMQGALPTHPELLDWLAVDFRENGWDIKRLVKQIVMSETYRQSSVVSSSSLKTDPQNKYLSRMTRRRFDAEIVRDHVLASSGLLNPEIGGPSVKPYQPEGLWDAATSGRGELKAYIQDHNEDLYRRGLYTFIKRTVPPPGMLIFDASNRDQCEVNRIITNTPLQALVLLNDPTVLEASRVLAEDLLTEQNNLEVPDLLEKAFRKIVCRKPSKKELGMLKVFYNEERLEMTAEIADEIIDVGEYPRREGLHSTDVAALMQTIVLIYNMEEATTRS